MFIALSNLSNSSRDTNSTNSKILILYSEVTVEIKSFLSEGCALLLTLHITQIIF